MLSITIYKVLTTTLMLNSVNMFKLFSRNSHTHSRTFFYDMKKETKSLKGIKSISNFYYPKSLNQEFYVNNLNDENVKIIIFKKSISII
jgi:hypothetical protein